MTKEERLLRQEQRERAKAIEAAAREAGRGPLDLPYLLLVLTLALDMNKLNDVLESWL